MDFIKNVHLILLFLHPTSFGLTNCTETQSSQFQLKYLPNNCHNLHNNKLNKSQIPLHPYIRKWKLIIMLLKEIYFSFWWLLFLFLRKNHILNMRNQFICKRVSKNLLKPNKWSIFFQKKPSKNNNNLQWNRNKLTEH